MIQGLPDFLAWLGVVATAKRVVARALGKQVGGRLLVWR